MRGVFAVGEPEGERWDLALELLREGEPFSLGRVTFRRTGPARVEAAVASRWNTARVSRERAREELQEARSWVERLLASDEAFRDAIGSSSLDYIVVFDYDNGSVDLYRLVGDNAEPISSSDIP